MLNSRDEVLIRLLGEDASQNSETLAEELNVSAATVRRRIKRLVRNGVLRIIAVVDPDKAGLSLAALLALDVSHDKLEAVSEQLATFPEVRWLSTTTGQYNLTALLRTDSNSGLSDFMETRLTRLDGVRNCETLLCLRVKKGHYVDACQLGVKGLQDSFESPIKSPQKTKTLPLREYRVSHNRVGKRKRTKCIGLVRDKIEAGFFDEPRSASEVKEHVNETGLIFTDNAITTSLRRLSIAGLLDRVAMGRYVRYQRRSQSVD